MGNNQNKPIDSEEQSKQQHTKHIQKEINRKCFGSFISYYEKLNVYEVIFKVNSNTFKTIGFYETLEDAHKAVKDKIVEVYGDIQNHTRYSMEEFGVLQNGIIYIGNN
jgi:hypothetical protein